jgi:hypothetical protein
MSKKFNRFETLLAGFSKGKVKEQKDKVLFEARKEVEINANGTSGYKIKSGSNEGKVLGHIQTKKKEI